MSSTIFLAYEFQSIVYIAEKKDSNVNVNCMWSRSIKILSEQLGCLMIWIPDLIPKASTDIHFYNVG